jgi:hypothetical protein
MNDQPHDQTHPNPESDAAPNQAANNGARDTNDHRGNGKIARLPKALRDQVNAMIRDGLAYQAIRDRLQDAGHPELSHISDQNFYNWKSAGYRRWLREQEWRDDMKQTRAEALECIGGEDDSKLEHVALKTASMRLYQLFKQFDAIDFSASVENKPEAYTRLFSALPRITREALRYQKYRDACSQARTEVQKLKDPHRKLTDSERLAIVHKVDEILGLRSPDHDDHESNPAPHPEIASSFDS